MSEGEKITELEERLRAEKERSAELEARLLEAQCRLPLHSMSCFYCHRFGDCQKARDLGRSGWGDCASRTMMQLPDVVYVYSATRGALFWSPNVETVLGLSSQDLRERPFLWHDSIHPEDLPIVDEAIRGGGPEMRPDLEYRIRRSDGEWRWIHDRFVSSRDEDGDVVIEGLATDITERKRTLESLFREREGVRRYLDIAAVVLVVLDRDQTVALINRRGCDVLGLPESEIVGKNWFDCFVPDRDRESTRGEFLRLMAGEVEPVERFENSVLNAAGEERLVLWNNTVLRGEDGTAEATLSSGEDVTDRRRMERSLAASEEKYRRLVENLQEGIWEIDAEAKTSFVNRRMAEMLGYSEEEMLGRHLFSFMDEAGVAICQRNLERREQGIREQHDFQFLRKDGTRMYALLETAPYTNEAGEYLGSVAGVQDITERKRYQSEIITARDQAEAATRAKSAFLANMSHELRTPLNGVLGLVQVLELSNVSPEQREHLASIKGCGKALLQLISDVLDISKIEAGKLELVSAPFRVGDLLGDLECMFAAHAHQKGLQLAISMAPETPEVLQGDELRLKQILTNLMGNAVKYTERGGVRLSVEGRRCDGRFLALFSVSDDGIGIPEDRQEEIFRDFSQAERDTHRRFGGTGLGLAIVRQLVDLMEGEIELKSSPGEGSTFSVQVELEVAPSGTRAEDVESPSEAPPVVPGVRVLVAEDDAVSQVVAASMLESLGCEVDLVDDGAKAVARACCRSYDVIFMDVQMPDMDGYQATREIRQMEAESANEHRVPIVAMTAYATEEDRQRCLDAGMDDFVTKPVELGRVREKLASLGREDGS